MPEKSDAARIMETPASKIDLAKCAGYYKFVQEVCRVVRDAIDTVIKEPSKNILTAGKTVNDATVDNNNDVKQSARDRLLYVREDDELLPDSKALKETILVCDGIAPDFLDTSFGRIKFSRRSRLRLHDNGLLSHEALLELPEDEQRIFYDVENSKPFLGARASIFRQLETQHWNINGPAKRVLAVNHLPITDAQNLWELPWEARIQLWEKCGNMQKAPDRREA